MIKQDDIDSIKKEFDGKWVGDTRRTYAVGELGFLLEVSPIGGFKRLELRNSPVRTAGQLDDLLFGMVRGSRTDVEALGVATVTAVAPRNPGRAQILTLWDQEMEAALLELGYPDISRDPYSQDTLH